MKKMMLCLLCFIFTLAVTGCGFQPKMDKTDEEMVTLTLTPQYATDITDEWLETNVGTFHQSFERQADDSVVLKMTVEQYTDYIESIRSSIIKATQTMVANNNNITAISHNEQFSEFEITVKTDTLYPSDADSVYYMFTALGRFYHYLTTQQYMVSGLEEGMEECLVSFTFLDANGNILEENYIPE